MFFLYIITTWKAKVLIYNDKIIDENLVFI